jgi:hypothetical protein
MHIRLLISVRVLLLCVVRVKQLRAILALFRLPSVPQMLLISVRPI